MRFKVHCHRILLLGWSMLNLNAASVSTATPVAPVPGTPVAYVDPFIGASTNMDRAGTYHGLGKTFPGATTPFGMVQISPNTITGGDNGSGYSHEHTTIEGFALTQMSGVGWYGDLGNFLIMPTTGTFHAVAGKRTDVSAAIGRTTTRQARRPTRDITAYNLPTTGSRPRRRPLRGAE